MTRMVGMETMILQLNGQSERMADPSREFHREFYGRVFDQMPLLVSGRNKQGEVDDVPRNPASFAYVLERRMEAPQDVREAWQNNYFSTGDSLARGVDGSLVSTWDSPILRTVTPESTLLDGALRLSTAQWNELRAQKDGTLYLSADEVAQLDGQGYVKKNSVWTPENPNITKVWEHLSRGRDLKEYVEMVADARSDNERIMHVYLDQDQLSSPTLRGWVANRIDNSSPAYGYYLCGSRDRLVGIATLLS